MVAPDPRWFALQKLWMAAKPERDTQKKPKDLKQGIAVLDATWVAMRHYPLDNAFFEGQPNASKPHFELWDAKS